MKTKLLSLLLALLLCLPLATAAFAAEPAFIVDRLQRLSADDLEDANEEAEEIREEHGVAVFLAYVTGHADDTDHKELVGNEKDYVILILGERGTRLYTGGKGDVIFSDPDDRDRLGYVHDEMDSWDEAVERYLEVAEDYLEKAAPTTTTAAPTTAPASSEKAEEKDGSVSSIWIVATAAVVLAVIGIIVKSKKKS